MEFRAPYDRVSRSLGASGTLADAPGIAGAHLGPFGISISTLVLLTGIGLLGFAGLVFGTATTRLPGRRLVWLIIALDALWVLDSVVLLTAYPKALTGLGAFALIDVAILVSVLAGLQGLGLAQLRQAARQTS